MEDCLFCKIINGEIPCYKIYENDFVLSFLDISNDGNGHILVLPKIHTENLISCSDALLSESMKAVKLIASHLVNNCGFDGVNVISNCGKSAEQSIMHLHFHILPRKNGDEIKVFPNLKKCSKSLEELCAQLRIEE